MPRWKYALNPDEVQIAVPSLDVAPDWFGWKLPNSRFNPSLPSAARSKWRPNSSHSLQRPCIIQRSALVADYGVQLVFRKPVLFALAKAPSNKGLH